MTPPPAPHLPLNERLRAVAARLSPVVFGFDLAASERLEQRRVLRERLTSMAWIVAIGVLAWIPIDVHTLPTPGASHLLGLRLVLATGVMLVAWSQRGDRRVAPVPALFVFVIAQAIGFAWMEAKIPADAAPLVRLGYGLFPFVIAAQIAVFPLPLMQSLALSLPALGLLLLPAWQGPFAPELSLYGSVWLLLLIILISAWAGTSQLLLLRELLRARNDAAHDGLTGLANRRSAMLRLDGEVAQARRHGQPLSLLALDLDHFKRVNDTYGHAAGDRVLIEFAAILRDSLRLGDLGARVGGEEFIAILPQTDVPAAMQVAERIREHCEALHVRSDDGAIIRFTISIGLARLDSEDNATRLLQRADAALYEAKHTGRNRVTRAA
ncbi:MAG TPA: GGDEF domain-containing protein [Xanthomonadales bacterium]|nr:GGDEF domain-containing protein [Xanthomonadales bacterium]